MTNFQQHVRKVGDRIFQDPTVPVPAGPQITFSTAHVIEMLVFLDNPTRAETRAVESGRVRFALVTQPSVLLLLATFDTPEGGPGVPWFDMPWQASREQHPGFPEGEDRYLALPITLVDSQTGLIKAMRMVTLSPQMTTALRGAVNYQIAHPSDDATAGRAINNLYARYPDNAALVKQRAEVTCTGGAGNAGIKI